MQRAAAGWEGEGVVGLMSRLARDTLEQVTR